MEAVILVNLDTVATKYQVKLCSLRGKTWAVGWSISGEAHLHLCSVVGAIPFLISITGLAHLSHLSDQAIGNFHLIIGLGKTLIQFSAPSQLYSISVFQFLKERSHMKETRGENASLVFMLERKASLVLMEAKPSAVNLTNSVSFPFCT